MILPGAPVFFQDHLATGRIHFFLVVGLGCCFLMGGGCHSKEVLIRVGFSLPKMCETRNVSDFSFCDFRVFRTLVDEYH
jgi:hypothetical protein